MTNLYFGVIIIYLDGRIIPYIVSNLGVYFFLQICLSAYNKILKIPYSTEKPVTYSLSFLSGRRNLSIFRTKISLLNGKYILSIHSLFCRYSYAACKYSRAVAAACTFFVFPENCEKKFIFLHDEWIFFRMSFFWLSYCP